jgi:replicative DNA helicase
MLTLFTSLVNKGAEKLDANLIISEAQAMDILELIGGFKYIQAMEGMRLSDENFEVYLKAVAEATTKYRLHDILSDTVDKIERNAKDGLESTELLSQAEGRLFELSLGRMNIEEPKNFADGLADYIEERRENKVDIIGLSTGYPILDKQIDGMVPSTLLVIAARKKMGKSALLTNIATHVAVRLRKTVLYVDTELSYEEWRPRALSILSGVPERDIKHGGYDQRSYERLQKAVNLINRGGKLFHEYMPGYSVDKLVALYKKYKIKEDSIDFLFSLLIL